MASPRLLLFLFATVAPALAQTQTGLPLETIMSFEGDSPFLILGGGVGRSLDLGGDMDGDGVADLIVGMPHRTLQSGTRRGLVRVISGRSGCTLREVQGSGVSASNPLGEGFGWAVAATGDVDGDGFDDFAVGAPFESQNGYESGRVYVLSGRDRVLLHTFDGGAPDELFGMALAVVGDVDGRGKNDLLIGAPGRNDALGQGPVEYARLVALEDGAVLRRLSANTTNGSYGLAVAGLGDVDGDGVPDYAIGASRSVLPAFPVHDLRGVVHVYSGGSNRTVTLEGDNDFDALGHALDAGDVDGDGVADLIAGAPFHLGQGATGPGYVRVYSGSSLGAALATPSTVVQVLMNVTGTNLASHFGEAVAFAGDVDGHPNGRAEVLVGSPWHEAGVPRTRTGRAALFSYDPNNPSPPAVFEVIGSVSTTGAGDLLGTSLVGGADLTGDGLAELIVGNGGQDVRLPNGREIENAGEVLVFGFTGPLQRPHAGSGEDFLLETFVNGVAGTCNGAAGLKEPRVGEVLAIRLSSPNSTFLLEPVLLIAQLFPTGSPPTLPGFPAVHVNPTLFLVDPRYSPWITLLGNGPLGPVVLPGQGILLDGYVMPSFLLGQSVMLQAAALSPQAINGIAAFSDAHEIRVR